MKVFIGWSGERSRAVAQALHEWIPNVIQVVHPWMSEQDASKGSGWIPELLVELGQASFGIICVTPENREAPWLAFEAGALKVMERPVCPFLLGLEPSDLQGPGPLTLFQSVKAEREDLFLMMRDVNQALGDMALTNDLLRKQFDRCWPDLEKNLAGALSLVNNPATKREVREMVEEILEIVRADSRNHELSQARVTSFREFLKSIPDLNVEKIKGTLEAKRKMMVVTALDRGTISIDGDYFCVDYSPEDSHCKSQIEARDKRIAIEDACEEVLGRRLTLRASIKNL